MCVCQSVHRMVSMLTLHMILLVSHRSYGTPLAPAAALQPHVDPQAPALSPTQMGTPQPLHWRPPEIRSKTFSLGPHYTGTPRQVWKWVFGLRLTGSLVVNYSWVEYINAVRVRYFSRNSPFLEKNSTCSVCYSFIERKLNSWWGCNNIRRLNFFHKMSYCDRKRYN